MKKHLKIDWPFAQRKYYLPHAIIMERSDGMDRETLVRAKRFATALKEKINVNRLILFGSRARGDNFVMSDFDFVLVSGDFLECV